MPLNYGGRVTLRNTKNWRLNKNGIFTIFTLPLLSESIKNYTHLK